MAKAKQQSADIEEPKIVRANMNRRNEKSETFATFYANDAQFQTTPWDIRVTFGEIAGTPSETDPTLLIKELFEVRMSPQFAKRVAMVLVGQIKHYEQTVGLIPMPED